MNILHPVNYFRDFQKDFPPILRSTVAISALSLLTTHQPFAKALTPVFNCFRTVTHLSLLVELLKQNQINRLDAAYHLLQSGLSVSILGLSILNPIYGMAGSALTDMISNAKECLIYLKKGQHKESIEALARLTLSSLFLGTICYGSIELTVAMLILQIVLQCYESIQHFKNGEHIEGLLKALTAGIYINRTIPQAKVLQWIGDYKPKMEAVLRQDERGFVYLDIPDDYILSLHEHLEKDATLPPYFGPGKSGAHVSIIATLEMAGEISELGKTFEFRIAQTDSLKPLHFDGVSQVSFLTLACPEMESLRIKYGFTPRLNGHDFHLTYALKYN